MQRGSIPQDHLLSWSPQCIALGMVIHPAIGLYCLSEFPSTWVTVSLSLFTTIDALLSSLAGCFLTPLWSWQILTLKSPLSGGLSIAFSTSLMFLPPFYPLSPFRTDMIFHLLYLDWQVPCPTSCLYYSPLSGPLMGTVSPSIYSFCLAFSQVSSFLCKLPTGHHTFQEAELYLL